VLLKIQSADVDIVADLHHLADFGRRQVKPEGPA
jgi:hypothetical protein